MKEEGAGYAPLSGPPEDTTCSFCGTGCKEYASLEEALNGNIVY